MICPECGREVDSMFGLGDNPTYYCDKCYHKQYDRSKGKVTTLFFLVVAATLVVLSALASR